MIYVINGNGVVINKSVGKPPLQEGDTSIEKNNIFGNIGDRYDLGTDKCYPLKRGQWESLNTETLIYEYNDDQLEPAKALIISRINDLCDKKDTKPFEYPINSGLFYKVTDAVMQTLKRGEHLNGTEPIPCNGGKWDTFDAGVSTPFTMSDLVNLYNHGYDGPAHNYTTKKTHIGTVMALETTKEVVEYDYTTGWF